MIKRLLANEKLSDSDQKVILCIAQKVRSPFESPSDEKAETKPKEKDAPKPMYNEIHNNLKDSDEER